MNGREKKNGRSRYREAKTIFFAMIAEMDLVVKNLINIFFISHFLGAEGAAAYEVVMPCIMLASAFVALGYNGVQAVCAKDYGANDFTMFERHKNAGYSWLIMVMTAFTLLLTLFKEPMLDLLGANDGSAALALLSRDCYSIFLFCFIPQSIFSLAVCFMYLEERRQLLITNLILYGCILAGNIIVTVSGPSMTGYMLMNVIGIAAADLYIILSCFIIRRKSSKVAFTAWNMHLADIRESFFTGLPDFMEYGFVGVLYLAENLYLLTRFSESVVAGVGVFEAIDNLPEVICVGFSFLVTAMLGTRVGKVCGTSSAVNRDAAKKELDETARRITKGGVVGSLFVAAALLLLARPFVGLILSSGDAVATESAILLTFSCAIGFVFYMLNSELVCYYKIVGAYIPAHILFFSEALLFPLGFKLILGEVFGVTGFCLGGAVGEITAFLLNLCIIWRTTGRFPRRISDFRMDRYLQRLIQSHEKDVREI